MELFPLLLLALLQGITEFLPISSSAHLVLLSELVEAPEQLPAISIALNAATLLSEIIYFSSDIKALIQGIFKKEKKALTQLLALILATIPIAVMGFALHKHVAVFHNIETIAYILITASALLILLEGVLQPRIEGKIILPSWRRGAYIGLFQAVAILPGVSRTGMAMVAGRLFGLTKKEAARFSFLLAIPTIAGALIIALTAEETLAIALSGVPIMPLIAAALLAFLT